MLEQKDYQKIVDECNEECARCIDDYLKSGIDFQQGSCRYCPTGARLHEALLKVSKAEKKWGDQDWNSSQLKQFYNG